MDETKSPATEAIDIKKRDPRADIILESLRNGGSILAACKGAGIHPATFWRWRQDNKELNAETEAAITSRIMIVEDALYNECIKGNATLIMFFLMNRAGENWKDKRAQPTVGVGVRVENNGISTIPDKDLRGVVSLAERVNQEGGQAS